MQSPAATLATAPVTAASMIRSTIERIERLAEDKAAVMLDMKEVYAEAKGNGFDVRLLRQVVRRRAQDSAKRAEDEAVIELYEAAIG